MALTQAQFDELTQEGQVTYLNTQLAQLEQHATLVTEEPTKTIIQKITGFIKVFLMFSTSMFTMVKGLVGTTN